MLYQRPSFTCPATSPKTSERTWDLAFLPKKNFMAKYQITAHEYTLLQQGD